MKVDRASPFPVRERQQLPQPAARPKLVKQKELHDPVIEAGDNLEKVVSEANSTIEAINVSMRFRVHKESERMLVQVIDVENKKVIKEIPPEQVLDLMGRIREMIGLILDEKR